MVWCGMVWWSVAFLTPHDHVQNAKHRENRDVQRRRRRAGRRGRHGGRTRVAVIKDVELPVARAVAGEGLAGTHDGLVTFEGVADLGRRIEGTRVAVAVDGLAVATAALFALREDGRGAVADAVLGGLDEVGLQDGVEGARDVRVEVRDFAGVGDGDVAWADVVVAVDHAQVLGCAGHGCVCVCVCVCICFDFDFDFEWSCVCFG
mmetsp:Transcript_22636/g.63133  ORF Transcript_22636/g.63133 Transcript_22636/m.63133 type:complete len:205 (+) Transcript_22636:68-682(+)